MPEMTVDEILSRANALEQEAAEFDAARCHGLAQVKRRDAAFYRRQLGQGPLQAAHSGDRTLTA